MKAVGRVLLSRWLLTGIGALLLALLVWFFGPLLGFLASPVARAAVIAVIAVIWAVTNWLIGRRRRRADDTLSKGVTESQADPAQAASSEEVAAVRDKLTTALSLLKRARGTRGYLYEQPWYVIIGPPGAGKTTALVNAGLKFPLAAEMGQGPTTGVGGTRMCDWWFTEQAVLIDTAGRYTTQDSDAAVDKAGWEGFLDLLRRTRARQPLNGAIVAISVPDVAQASPAERLAHAGAIRRRIKELTDKLAVRIPVYALFTKSDLVSGFTEFFDDLDRERRAQVWGTTFALDAALDTAAGTAREQGPVARFGEEFRLLVARLNERLFDRLQAERSPERRAMIAGFPAQVASLESPMTEFLNAAFGGSRLDPAPFLRGVYLASGTQEGTPIDRLTGVLAQAFGVDQRRAASLRPEQGRSYFLGRLLRDVIFNEAMLVSERPGLARRRWLLRGGAFAAVAVVTIAVAALLFGVKGSNEADIARTRAALAQYEQIARGLPLDPVNDADLPRVAPLLDAARALPYGYDTPLPGSGFGLSQAAKLAAASRTVYRHALVRVLLPRLVWRLESQMRGNINRPDFLYEATRVYLMLGSQGPLDPDLVREWMKLDWAATYPGAAAQPFRQDLAAHLDALLTNPLPPVTLDGALVADARATFSRVSLAERVYSRIRPSAAARAIPAWTPGEALGASGARVFVRASGKPLTDGIPGFYTVRGFHDVLLPSLPATVKQVAGESWVLGTRSEVDPRSPEVLSLEHDVVALYVADYEKQWDAMLADLDVVPLRNMNDGVQNLYILSSPQSPMRDLLASIARQLTLSQAPKAAPGVAGKVAAAQAAAASAAAASAARLQGLLGQQTAPAAPPGQAVDVKYKALRDFVGKGPGAPIDGVLKLLNDLQQQLSKLAGAAAGGSAPAVATGEDPGALIRAEATRDPEPVSRWLLTLASTGNSLRGGGAKAQVAAAFNGSGGPAQLCQQAVAGRYPFTAGAANEIPLDDFSHLFAPGGMIDGFFNTQLRPFVDMSSRNWKLQKVDGVSPPISQGDLRQFQRAAVIRDLFFGGGGTSASVRFDITPVSADAGSKQVLLDFNGVTVEYAHGPVRATQITWPGPQGMNDVRLTFDPPPSSGPPVLEAQGPWALFRLFNKGTLARAGGAEQYQLTFHLGDRQAVYSIRAGSVNNPFTPGVLQEFSCPHIQ